MVFGLRAGVVAAVIALSTAMGPAAHPAAAQEAGEGKGDAPTGAPVPPAEVVVMLARSTLVALNHANRTGNYAVLRDLGAPSFREANNPARLARIFESLRSQNMDLAPVAVLAPMFSRPPSVSEDGMLRLAGSFPTRPLQTDFQLLYEAVGGEWRLFGISINTRPPQQG